MLSIILNPGEEENILSGFSWVFNNEVASFEGEIVNGEVVKVLSSSHQFVCYGFFNMSSKIMVRLLSYDESIKIDKTFFKNRIEEAIAHRATLQFQGCCRLIFAESDFLPGLIVDQYSDILVVQFLSLGMELIKKDIVDILVEILNPRGIYERSDSPVRIKEGLEQVKGFLYKEFDTKVIVQENDILMQVDVENGQKTGYFLDQKLNRDYLKHFVKNKVVLDCFSHTGGFALHAAKYGASLVDACDISQKATTDIAYNAKLNQFTQINAICVDVFDYLRGDSIKNKYDVIILDPPAFTKTKETVKKAYRGYKEINLQALKNIKHGGYLFTFSCSQHMTAELFMQMIKEAIVDSKRRVQMIDFKIQSPDHPTLPASSEQLYLKCIVLRILDR